MAYEEPLAKQYQVGTHQNSRTAAERGSDGSRLPGPSQPSAPRPLGRALSGRVPQAFPPACPPSRGGAGPGPKRALKYRERHAQRGSRARVPVSVACGSPAAGAVRRWHRVGREARGVCMGCVPAALRDSALRGPAREVPVAVARSWRVSGPLAPGPRGISAGAGGAGCSSQPPKPGG